MEDMSSPLAVIYVVALIFGAAVLLLIGYTVYTSFNEALLDSGHLDDNEDARQVVEDVGSYGHLMDYAFLFFILAFLLAMPIAAYFAPTHPALIVGFIFVFFLALTMSVLFSDTFELMGEDEFIEPYYAELPILKNLMHFLPLLVIINSVVTGTILYGKARAGAGEY